MLLNLLCKFFSVIHLVKFRTELQFLSTDLTREMVSMCREVPMLGRIGLAVSQFYISLISTAYVDNDLVLSANTFMGLVFFDILWIGEVWVLVRPTNVQVQAEPFIASVILSCPSYSFFICTEWG